MGAEKGQIHKQNKPLFVCVNPFSKRVERKVISLLCWTGKDAAGAKSYQPSSVSPPTLSLSPSVMRSLSHRLSLTPLRVSLSLLLSLFQPIVLMELARGFSQRDVGRSHTRAAHTQTQINMHAHKHTRSYTHAQDAFYLSPLVAPSNHEDHHPSRPLLERPPFCPLNFIAQLRGFREKSIF